jgi:hypothetical protein
VNPALQVLAELLRATRRGDERDDVALDRLGDSDMVNLSASIEDGLLRGDISFGRCSWRLFFFIAHQAHDFELIGIARIAHHNVQ